MQVKIEIGEKDLKAMVHNFIKTKMNHVDVRLDDIKIMVKSKQNYKSEWEQAEFKAEYFHIADAGDTLL